MSWHAATSAVVYSSLVGTVDCISELQKTEVDARLESLRSCSWTFAIVMFDGSSNTTMTREAVAIVDLMVFVTIATTASNVVAEFGVAIMITFPSRQTKVLWRVACDASLASASVKNVLNAPGNRFLSCALTPSSPRDFKPIANRFRVFFKT